MPWVKLDDGFYANPKVIRAKPLARSLYLAGLCHCASGLTDGQITKAAIPLLMAQTGATRAMAANLVAVGLWHDRGDHYEVHDWQEFNASAQAVSERRKAEREKKARQRASGSAKSIKGDGGRFVSPGDRAGDTPRESPPPSRRESPATRPDPTQVLPSSVTESGVEPDVAGAGAPAEEDRSPTNPEALAAAAIAHMARCDLRADQAKGTLIKNPDAWLRKAETTRRSSCWPQLLAAATERPTTDPVTLAEQLDPACGPDDGGHARALARAAETDQAVADSAAIRAERARADQILSLLPDDQRAELEAQVDTDAHPAVRLNAIRALALEWHFDLLPMETPNR